MIKKPCRYKACKGKIHINEKCPIASKRGSSGGKNGTKESKQRFGLQNGNAKHLKKAGYRECCNTLKSENHNENCKNARIRILSKKLDLRLKSRQITFSRPEISWKLDSSISVQGVKMMLRGINGFCDGCKKPMKAIEASKIHKNDITSHNPRIICGVCN